jgi:hypothetical protein
MKRRVPKFKNEDEERDFWSKNDSSEYLNWKSAEPKSFPYLNPSAEAATSPDVDELNALIRQARKQAKKVGLKKKDVGSAITKVRRRGSKQQDGTSV